MAWIRLEDTFPEHRKIDAAGGDAAWLHVCGIGYCNRNRTDGHIPTERVPRLSDRKQPHKLAERLVAVGLWEKTDTGYLVHDYLEYNPTRDELDSADAERSRKKSEAGKLGGIASGIARRKHNRSTDEAEGQPNTNEIEAPTRPDPVPVVTSANNSHQQTPDASTNDEADPQLTRMKAVATRYAELRWNQADQGRIGNPREFKNREYAKALEMRDTPRLVREYPDAPVDVLANALNGEKNSLRYYQAAS